MTNTIFEENNKTIEITHKNQMIDYFVRAFKPKSHWRLGVEHEKILSTLDNKPFLYEAHILPLFQAFKERGWQEIKDDEGILTGLSNKGRFISLEPGLQLELAGAPFKDLQDIYQETENHFKELKDLSATIPFRILLCGFSPTWSLHDYSPPFKSRFRIMKQYMEERHDTGGLDMMFRTTGIQVSLDFSDEEDMVQKMRVAMALQPIVTALFACSPFCEGQKTSFLSYRSYAWSRSEKIRSGILPFVFDPSFNIERYVDYSLTVPMYFVHRDKHIPLNGITFKEFLESKEYHPTLYDFSYHLTTLFPEVRLKKVIEMRGADMASKEHITALAALWAGLLYRKDALEEMHAIIQTWPAHLIEQLRADVPRLGLQATIQGQKVLTLARYIVNLAAHNLSSEDASYLQPLFETLNKGITPAEEALQKRKNGENIIDIFALKM